MTSAVYNRTRSKAEPLADLGATIVDAPAELGGPRHRVHRAGRADRLPAGADRARGPAVGDGRHPAVVVDSTTISAEASAVVRAEAEKRGTALLAAPVSGNPKVVKAGRLTMVTSGPRDGPRSRPSLSQHPGRRRGDLRRRRRARAAGQGVPQPDARDHLPVAGRDPRARRKGRHLARRHDGVPQQQRARFHLHPLQDAGLREPRLLAHLHAAAPAQGLRPRLRGGP